MQSLSKYAYYLIIMLLIRKSNCDEILFFHYVEIRGINHILLKRYFINIEESLNLQKQKPTKSILYGDFIKSYNLSRKFCSKTKVKQKAFHILLCNIFYQWKIFTVISSNHVAHKILWKMPGMCLWIINTLKKFKCLAN